MCSLLSETQFFLSAPCMLLKADDVSDEVCAVHVAFQSHAWRCGCMVVHVGLCIGLESFRRLLSTPTSM